MKQAFAHRLEWAQRYQRRKGGKAARLDDAMPKVHAISSTPPTAMSSLKPEKKRGGKRAAALVGLALVAAVVGARPLVVRAARRAASPPTTLASARASAPALAQHGTLDVVACAPHVVRPAPYVRNATSRAELSPTFKRSTQH